MIWNSQLLIVGVFLISLTDLVLCLLAFSDMAKAQKQGYSWLYWIALCALVPVLGPLAYFLVKEKGNA